MKSSPHDWVGTFIPRKETGKTTILARSFQITSGGTGPGGGG